MSDWQEPNKADEPTLFDQRYRLIEKLGQGGMGLVYLAEDTRLGRRVALKLLPSIHDDETYRARFYREARAASKLNHPGIATIYDYGTAPDGRPFIVMEFVTGQTLAALLESGNLSLERAVEIIEDVSAALGEAHKQGVIHRDIKPANLAISSGGKVKILDFGLAKEVEPIDSGEISQGATLLQAQTQPGVMIGTPLYLSPEQARGADVDMRSDIFALGSVLYECITGVPAFSGDSLHEIRTHVIHFEPPPPSKFNPSVPTELDRITLKALAKEPRARYQNTEEFRTDLSEVHQDIRRRSDARTQQLSTPFTSFRKSLQLKRSATGKLVSLLAAVLVISLLVWIGWRFWPRSTTQQRLAAQFWYDRGIQSLRDGTYFQARKLLEEAVKNDHSYALAHARLAEALMELDETDRAQKEMLTAEDGRADLDQLDQLHLTAIKAMVQRDFPKAVESYAALQQRRSDQQGVSVDLGRAYEKNLEVEKAIESYERATQINPQDAAAFLHLGRLYAGKRETEKALAAFAKAESLYQVTSNLEGQAEVFYQRGYFYNQVGKYTEARSQLERAISTVKDNRYQQVRTLLELSLTSCFKGETEQSQEIAGQAVEIARANAFDVLTAQALVGMGISLQCVGRNSDAQQKFEEGLTLARRYEARVTEGRAQLSLGSLQVEQGKTDAGLENARAALTLLESLRGFPSRVMLAHAVIGKGLRQKGEYDASIRAFTDLLTRAQALKNLDNIAHAHEGLGTAMLLQSRFPEALEHFQASLKAQQEKGEDLGVGYAFSNCGNALWRLGRYDEAAKMFDQALAIARGPQGYKNMLVEVNVNMLEMELSKRNFSVVSKMANHVLTLNDPRQLEFSIRAKRASALAKVGSGKLGEAKKLAQEAMKEAIDLGEPALIYTARSSLAEVLLEAQDPAGALELFRPDLDHLATANHQELLWRANAVATKASHQLGDFSNTRNYANQVREILTRIEKAWGPEAYQQYIKRPDIDFALASLKKLPQ